MSDLTASEVATRLGVSRRRVGQLLSGGALEGRQLANGTWLVDAASIARFETTTQRRQGRALDGATAWGLLWELSGFEATWLQPRTRARLRERIRALTPEALAKAVATRTKERRFAAASVERAREGLIATGRAAAQTLGTDLLEDRSRAIGYVRGETIEEYARAHFMLADSAGQHVLYENTLPIDYAADVMPPAVVAADLARSTDTRERSAGLRALEELRQAWLAAH